MTAPDLAATAASLAATAEKLAGALSSVEYIGNLLAEARRAGYAEGLGEIVEELPVGAIFEAGRAVGQAAEGARRATLHSLPGGAS